MKISNKIIAIGTLLALVLTLFLSVSHMRADSGNQCDGLSKVLQNVPPDSPAFEKIKEQLEKNNCGRYFDLADGTVLDIVTGLIWLKNANCFGAKTWFEATSEAATLNDGECSLSDGSSEGDWRLPTKEEWEATIDEAFDLGCTSIGAGAPPSLTDTAGTGCYADETDKVFTGVLSFNYWSSSSVETPPDGAWGVRLCCGDGIIGFKPGNAFVWPVRGGQ